MKALIFIISLFFPTTLHNLESGILIAQTRNGHLACDIARIKERHDKIRNAGVNRDIDRLEGLS